MGTAFAGMSADRFMRGGVEARRERGGERWPGGIWAGTWQRGREGGRGPGAQVALEEDEEIEAVLAAGVTTNIKFKAVSEVQPSGKRDVFFGAAPAPHCCGTCRPIAAAFVRTAARVVAVQPRRV